MSHEQLRERQERFFPDGSFTVVVQLAVSVRVPQPPAPPAAAAAAVSPRFEPDLFVQQPVADEMLCGVCLAVMNDPVSCADGAHKCAALRRRCSRPLPLR